MSNDYTHGWPEPPESPLERLRWLRYRLEAEPDGFVDEEMFGHVAFLVEWLFKFFPEGGER